MVASAADVHDGDDAEDAESGVGRYRLGQSGGEMGRLALKKESVVEVGRWNHVIREVRRRELHLKDGTAVGLMASEAQTFQRPRHGKPNCHTALTRHKQNKL